MVQKNPFILWFFGSFIETDSELVSILDSEKYKMFLELREVLDKTSKHISVDVFSVTFLSKLTNYMIAEPFCLFVVLFSRLKLVK